MLFLCRKTRSLQERGSLKGCQLRGVDATVRSSLYKWSSCEARTRPLLLPAGGSGLRASPRGGGQSARCSPGPCEARLRGRSGRGKLALLRGARSPARSGAFPGLLRAGHPWTPRRGAHRPAAQNRGSPPLTPTPPFSLREPPHRNRWPNG